MNHQQLDDITSAATAYAFLRQSLITPDTMTDDALVYLLHRVRTAARKYPSEGVAQKAMNRALEAYAEYILATMGERAAAQASCQEPFQAHYFDESSALSSAVYYPATHRLEITFASGGTYTYEDIEPGVFDGLRAAPSAGSYFARYIKPAKRA